MPGRKETPVHSLFIYTKNSSFKGTRAICKYCQTEVADNGTRKEHHIKNCQKCTDDIKLTYLGSKMEKIEAKQNKTIFTETSQRTAEQNQNISINPSDAGAISIMDSEESDNEIIPGHSTTAKIAPIFQKSSSRQSSLDTESNNDAAECSNAAQKQVSVKLRKEKQARLQVDTMSPEQNVSLCS